MVKRSWVVWACTVLLAAGCQSSVPAEEPQTVPSTEGIVSSAQAVEEESSRVETSAAGPDRTLAPDRSAAQVETEAEAVSSERRGTEKGGIEESKEAEPRETSERIREEATKEEPDLPEEAMETEAAIPDPPVAEPSTSASEPTQPPETTQAETEPGFSIAEWVAYAKSYAEGIGLRLDPEAVYCWDNPITAGPHSRYLERDISGRLERYKGDGSITAVWIWAEACGDGSYDLYIGYA